MSGVPAGTELLINGAFFASSLAFGAAGVSGSLNGCSAGEGADLEGAPGTGCAGEAGVMGVAVALRAEGVVVKKRGVWMAAADRWAARREVRMQVRQIMVWVAVGECERGAVVEWR